MVPDVCLRLSVVVQTDICCVAVMFLELSTPYVPAVMFLELSTPYVPDVCLPLSVFN